MNSRMVKKAIAFLLVFLMLPSVSVNYGIALTTENSGILQTVHVGTVEELREAVRTAQAGDEIIVASGEYNVTGLTGFRAGVIQAYGGEAIAGRPTPAAGSGTRENPIVLRGANPNNPPRIFSTNIQSGMIIHIWDSDFWIIRDLEIEGGQKGIMLDNSNHSVIRNNFVHSMGMEAIHLRDGSSYCQVIFNRVENTGLYRPGLGEAVYIGSAHTTTGYNHYTDFNYIAFNVFGPGIAGEPVDVKEFVTGTVIEHNIMHGIGIHGRNTRNPANTGNEVHASSFIANKGNDTIIRYNTFLRENNTGIRAGIEVHSVRPGWGYRTVVYGNIFDLGVPASWGPEPTYSNIWTFNPVNEISPNYRHWPTNPTHPVFAVGIWSGSAYVGENTIIEPAVRGSLQQMHAMSAGTLTSNLPVNYTGPDPRVPIYIPSAITPCEDCNEYVCECFIMSFPRNPELQLQTIYINPADWQGGGTLWTTEGWGGQNLVPNTSWTTLTIECYYESGVLEFSVRSTGGNQNFRIGLRANRHGRPTTIYWNDIPPTRTFTATPEWQTFSLSIKELVDAHIANPDFSLNDLWYVAVTGVSAGAAVQFDNVRISSPDDERQYSFIKINQVGYEVGRPKPAIVSYFEKFGSLNGRAFHVINATTGEIAYTGNLGTAILDPFSGGRSWSGEMLHHIYFCDLNTPGEFFIRIPNANLNAEALSPRDIAEGICVDVIESPIFTISRNVYEELLVDVIRYFFFQRQGIDLEPRYAGDFARPNLHPGDSAVRLWSDRNNPNPDPRNIYDISQGWYDAGDFGKYIVPSTTTVSDLLWAYELFPQAFAELDLNIPEANPGNPLFVNAPGILSELKWQLDKMLKFEHHSRDGSFFIAANYCGENNIIWIEDTLNRTTNHNSPANERDLRSHHATANMAAILAHAYLVYRDYEDAFPGFADEMLATAIRAWGWVTNPANPQHSRIDAANRIYSFGADDLERSMFWAAGALYRAVSANGGDTAPFLTHLQNNHNRPYVMRCFHGWTSVNYNHGGNSFKGFAHYLFENPAPIPAISARFTSPANPYNDDIPNGFADWRHIMLNHHANEWRITYPQWGLWWGSNQMITHNSLTMLLGSIIEAQLNGQDGISNDVIEHMEASVHYMLGLNPISFSYVSGHGERSVQNIFSAIFSLDEYARLEPYRIPPGYFTEGTNHIDNRHLSRFDGKCFVDSDGEWTTNENTIYHNAALTFLLAAIAAHTVPAEIYAQPQDMSVTHGEISGYLTIGANALGGALFQWEQHINGNWTEILGANAADFEIPQNLAEGSHLFRVVVNAPTPRIPVIVPLVTSLVSNSATVTVGEHVINNGTPLRPFPQAGQDTGLVVELMNMPAGQNAANMDILRQFANMIDTPNSTGSPLPATRSSLFRAAGQGGTGSVFLVDPATWNDPAGFRMVTTLDAGTGGTAVTPNSYRVTVCESMGYGMLMIVKLAGSEDTVLGGAFGDRTMRHVLWSGLPAPLREHFTYEPGLPNSVSFQTYFDAMFRSLRFWPTHFVHATNGHQGWNADVMNNVYRGGTPPDNFRHSYQMAWSIHHVWGGASAPGAPGFFRREAGPSTATDGSMDMAYALILASEQWGHEPAWSPVHRYERMEGYTYYEWARRMVQELFDVTVHHSRHPGTSAGTVTNPGYFLKIGNWANSNDPAGRLSRPSDHIMQHLKAFAAINPERDWQRVINVTYDSHRFIRQWHQPAIPGVSGGEMPNTGILPDFIRFDHNASSPQSDGTGNVWLIPAQNALGGSFHETVWDGAAHWNACRVPWRLGVDLLFSGRTPHEYSDITIAALNNWHAQYNNNNFNSVRGRWLDGRANGTVGATSNAFGGPMLVPAAVLGPQAWLNSGWARANPANLPAPSSFNFYGDYINILTMVAASGNEWTPVGSPLTVTGGTTANNLTHMRRVVAGARVPLRAYEQNPALFGGWDVSPGVEFWQGFTADMPNTYIVMPRNMPAFATADGTPPPTHLVTIITDGTNPLGSGEHAEGRLVSVNAGTNDGYAFAGWTLENCANTNNFAALQGFNSSNWATSFIMPSHPVTLTATWTEAPPVPHINHAAAFLYMFTLNAAGEDDWGSGFNNDAAAGQMQFDVTIHQDVTLNVTWPAATDGRTGVLHGIHRDIYVALPFLERSPDMLPVTLHEIRVNGTNVFGATNHVAPGYRWLVPGTIGSAANNNFVSFGGALANDAAVNNAFADADMQLRTFFLPENAFLIPAGATVEFILRVGDGSGDDCPVDCDCEICNPPFGAHTVTFSAYPGVFNNGQTYNFVRDSIPHGESIILPRMYEMSNPGYRFWGWRINGTTDQYLSDNSEISSNISVTAQWISVAEINASRPYGREPFQIGDANTDGRVTSADVTVIARWIILPEADRATRLPNFCEFAADISGTGNITPADMTLLAQWLVGYPVDYLISR